MLCPPQGSTKEDLRRDESGRLVAWYVASRRPFEWERFGGRAAESQGWAGRQRAKVGHSGNQASGALAAVPVSTRRV